MGSWKKRAVAFGLAMLLVCGTGTAFADTAAVAETPVGSEQKDTVTLSAHNSYVTQAYYSVIQIASGNEDVARASLDNKGRVVISAVGGGSTQITYWYKSNYLTGWTSVTQPVTVSGKAVQSSSVSSVSLGLAFSVPSLELKVGDKGTAGGKITLHDEEISASSLLWVSSNPEVITVDAQTGEYDTWRSGSASLCAVTLDGSYSKAISVEAA